MRLCARVRVHVRVHVWRMSPVSNELTQTLPAGLLQESLGLSGTLDPPSVRF